MEYKKTFYDKYIKKTCKLLMLLDDNQLKQTMEIINLFNEQKRKTLVFDLEFDKDREITLFQIGFHIDKELIIVIFNPILTPLIYRVIEPLFIDDTVIKIGHGTDSLDVPAIYNLLKDPIKTTKFIMKLYDTRFLCEYISTITKNIKCNVYHCMKIFNVVDDVQLDYLYGIESKLGKFWNKPTNIKTLSNDMITYAMYDVVYLKQLLKNIKKNIKHLNLDYKLPLQATRILLLSKVNLLNIPNSLYQSSNYLNLYETFSNTSDDKYKAILKNNLFKKYFYNILIFYYKNFKNENKNKIDINVINRIMEPFSRIKDIGFLFQRTLQ